MTPPCNRELLWTVGRDKNKGYVRTLPKETTPDYGTTLEWSQIRYQ